MIGTLAVPRLSVLGFGLELPAARPVRELAGTHGAAVDTYRGWDNVCIAGTEDHPSTLGAQALRKALDDAGLDADQLRIVIAAGVSRDYPASWGTAAEIMKLTGVSDGCLGLDITIGCMGMLAALNTVLGWLTVDGGGYAAIVGPERWSQTVDRSDVASDGMWANSDNGSAIVVGLNLGQRSRGDFVGASFVSNSRLNGHVLIKYGGTRHPVAPDGVNPGRRHLGDTPARELSILYQHSFQHAFGALRRRFGLDPTYLICNQISPQFVERIAHAAGVPVERTLITGHETGHLGGGDLVVGIQRLLEQDLLQGPVLLAGSTPYAFGAGMLLPPASSGSSSP